MAKTGAQAFSQIRDTKNHPRGRVCCFALVAGGALMQDVEAHFQSAMQRVCQFIRCAGLFKKPKGPMFHGAHRHWDVALAGEQHNRQIFIDVMRIVQQMKAIAPWHPNV